MNVREVTVKKVRYRGPLGCNSGETPWRITALLPSSRRSTYGRLVGSSWQTWKKFTSFTDSEEEMQKLEEHNRDKATERSEGE